MTPFIGLLAAMLLTMAGCTGLGGEPDVVATLPPPEPTPADIGFPAATPDLANGAQLFAENCTDCHGIDGSGNGALVLSGQVGNPGNFQDPTSARSQSVQEWFNTITLGNLEMLMPPWQQALSEQERWDVAYFTYFWHLDSDTLSTGEAVYAEHCADCHGIGGRGDGPQSAELGGVPSLLNYASQVTLSDDNIYTLVELGSLAAGMPAYADLLTEEEMWAVVAYSRSLTWQNTDALFANVEGDRLADAQAAAPDVAPDAMSTAVADAGDPDAERVVSLFGTVENLTAGAEVPARVDVFLRAFDPATFAPFVGLEQTVNVDAQGGYRFESVPLDRDKIYLTGVTYQGRDFASGIYPGDDPILGEEPLLIPIYELSDDPALLTINAAAVRIDAVGDALEVQQLMSFRNVGDRVFTSAEEHAEGGFRALQVPVPTGAIITGFDDPTRYRVEEAEDEGVPTVYDLRPVMPEEERLTFIRYLLPYDGGPLSLDFVLPYALGGEVRVVLSPYDTMRAESDQLPPAGEETIGDQLYQTYGQQLALSAGDTLRLTLSGEAAPSAVQPGVTVQEPSGVVDGETLVLALVVVIVVVALSAGAYVYLARRGRSAEDSTSQAEIDSLIGQIARLDAQHERSEINHDLYQRQRADLKARLAALMQGGLGTAAGGDSDDR